MGRSSRFTIIVWPFLTILLAAYFAFPRFAQQMSHAASVSPKHSINSNIQTNARTTKCTGWSFVPSQNPGTSNILNGVAATSASDVWTVGGYNTNGLEQTLIEHWDGTAWSVVSSPNVGTSDNFLLAAARVPGTSQIWAVGRYYNSSGFLQTLIEYWNDISWSVISSPNIASENNVLNGVTAASASNVWAVGYTSGNSVSQTLIEHWDGTSWSIVSGPNGTSTNSNLFGVTAISSRNIWAVGGYNNSNNVQQTLIEHWNGKKWSIVASPNPSATGYDLLLGVERIPGSNQLWAVGFYSDGTVSDLTLIERWDGTSWNIVPSPNPGSTNNFVFNTLSGVVAVSANNAWAVGSYYNANGYQTLVEHWNGTSWNVFSSPTPGSGQNTLSSVAKVPGSNHVWATGFYSNAGGYPQTLTESYC